MYGNLVKGSIAREMGKPDEALAHFSRASTWAHHLKSEGLRAMVHYHQAWLLLELGRPAGGEIARWAWKRWSPFEQTFFLWRWGDHPAVRRWAPRKVESPGEILRVAFPHLSWETWLDWMLEVMARDPAWEKRLRWKARRILAFVWRHTPETLRPHLARHPRYGALLPER